MVFDASTVLALLKGEAGGVAAVEHARGAILSAVNFTEVLSKLGTAIGGTDVAAALFERLEIEVVPFDAGHAKIAAELWPKVQGRNVSIADRACLALAIDREAPILTGDRKWLELGLPIDIRLFR